MTELEKQVDPRLVQLRLLSDIVREFAGLTEATLAIKKLQESMIEEGVVEVLEPKTVTTKGIVVKPPFYNKPWFGVKFTNDGPESVWIWVNTGKSNQYQELKSGETWGVSFKTAVIEDIALTTKIGKATVRIRGER